MTKESLLELREAINEFLLYQATMNEFDRVELIINMNYFLEPVIYDENIKVLKKNNNHTTL